VLSNLDPRHGSFDIPLVIALIIFATIIAFISFRLCVDFGWDNYKKIGADIQMQKMYKTVLIFVLFLKLGLFFVLLTAIEVIATLRATDVQTQRENYSISLSKGLYYFHLFVTIMILFLEILAYSSLRRENKPGMILYIILSTVTFVDFIIIFKASIKALDQAWYFFVVV
ncbi:2739_t:CDS:2, partial [Racocetra persica]